MNIFNITNLFRAYFIENKKMLLLCSIITFALVVWGFSSATPEISPFLPWIILLWIAGTFFQSSLKRNNSTHFYNLPVTAGEKLFYTTVLLLIMGIIFHLLSWAGAYTGRYLIYPLLHQNSSMEFRFTISEFLPMIKIEIILLYLAALFAFLFGSIYFKRNSFWITLASGTGIMLGIALYNLILLFITFGRDISGKNINLNYEFIGGHNYIFSSIIILFFLSLTYLRLKETEV